MARQIFGDLHFGTVRVGARVVCVRLPDMTYWEDIAKSWRMASTPVALPVVRGEYTIRTISKEGVLLMEVKNTKLLVNSLHGTGYCEPIFPFSSFCLKSP